MAGAADGADDTDGGWTARDAAGVLSAPTPTDDKYSRGVLGVRTGSPQYPGAAVLGVEAAWRTGIGMVRYLGAGRPTDLVLARRPETVTVDGRVQAWLIGSGTDAATRDAAETAALRGLLAGEVPVIADAGALDLVAGDPRRAAPVVVTPHDREHARLREALGLASVVLDGSDAADDQTAATAVRAAAAAETAATAGVTVLLKGHVTVVATPSGWTRTVTAPTAWLATAGTGDVLAGVLGALTASAAARRSLDVEDLGPLAATAAWVHGHAAAAAVEAAGGGPITALDVADALPPVIGRLLRGA